MPGISCRFQQEVMYESLLSHCRSKISTTRGDRLSTDTLEDCCRDVVHDVLLHFSKNSCTVPQHKIKAYADSVFNNKVKSLLKKSYYEDTVLLDDLEEESHWKPYIDTSITDYRIYLLSASQTLMSLCKRICDKTLPGYIDLNNIYVPIICQALGSPVAPVIQDKRASMAVRLCVHLLKQRIHEEMPYHD